MIGKILNSYKIIIFLLATLINFYRNDSITSTSTSRSNQLNRSNSSTSQKRPRVNEILNNLRSVMFDFNSSNNLNNSQTVAFSSTTALPSFSTPATTTIPSTASVIYHQSTSYSTIKDNHHNYSSRNFNAANKSQALSSLQASASEPEITPTPNGNSLQCPICLENFDEVSLISFRTYIYSFI